MPLFAERVALGRRLFFDSVLSKDRSVSCASCHRPENGFASPDTLAIGISGRVGKRNSPTLLNRAFGTSFFWDGRAKTLEEQVLLPITTDNEFDFSVAGVLERLAGDESYFHAFRHAFEPSKNSEIPPVTAENLAAALAAFVRTLHHGDTPVDRFQAGTYSALSASARRGLWVFESRGGCWACHSGPNFSDEKFHNTGVGYGEPTRDLGRFDATKKPVDRHRFKTPTLRGLKHTAPYMHNGSQATLEDVVLFYDRGGARFDSGRSSLIRPLHLTDQDVDDLVAFLEALSRPGS